MQKRLKMKLKEVRQRIKRRLRPAKRTQEDADTSAFVWVGGFQPQRVAGPETRSRSPSPSLSPATLELQMAWYRNFSIRFFQDEVQPPSPAQRIQEIQPGQVGRPSEGASTQTQLRAFRAMFPDYKIYHYHSPTPAPGPEYRNLVPGHTPAPPLPPRNPPRSPPPVRRTLFTTHCNETPVRRSYSSECLNYSYLL